MSAVTHRSASTAEAQRSGRAVADDLDRIAVVVLEFPKFTDGRAYVPGPAAAPAARLSGELRATGNVLRDQLLFMDRCGIDAIEVADTTTAAIVAESLGEFYVFYQPAADGSPSVIQQRYGEHGKPVRRPHACCQN